MQASHRESSVLVQRANDVDRCMQALSKEGYTPVSVHITETYAAIEIRTTPHCKKLFGREAKIVNLPSGRFQVMQVVIHNVHVQWLRPFSYHPGNGSVH